MLCCDKSVTFTFTLRYKNFPSSVWKALISENAKDEVETAILNIIEDVIINNDIVEEKRRKK